MVDCDCKSNMVQSTPKPAIKRATSDQLSSQATELSCLAYESYLRLPELRQLWSSSECPGWESESIVKPALQALEITFRFISIILSDPRPYVNRREWSRRLESLARDQVELISLLCEDNDTHDMAPIVNLTTFGEVVPQTGRTAEVWKLSGEGPCEYTVVSRISEYSLLPRLATWLKAEELSSRVLHSIESSMGRCTFTLGLGEANLAGKPNLDYDAVCRPSELHALKKSALEYDVNNYEDQVLFTIHQILESWIFSAKQLVVRIQERIDREEYSKAADDCWILEKIWKLLKEIENLHMLMDPDDFLHLKTQLKLKTTSESDAFCFRSRGLIEITKLSKDLRHNIPKMLGVEVDPMGGPRVQEAVMQLYTEKGRFEKVHLLQAFQGVESAVKGFFFNYKQLLVIMMGSLEAKSNTGGAIGASSLGMLEMLFLEPAYYPSLNGAKTFLGNSCEREQMVGISGGDRNQYRGNGVAKR